MKKIILLLAISGLFAANCKKKTNPLKQEAWCVYKITSNGAKTFYNCYPTSDDAGKACVELRNQGFQYSSVKKSKCSEC